MRSKFAILLVEDELHKMEELSACLDEFYGDKLELVHVDSVRGAFWEASTKNFDLIILDMALPTFSSEMATAERGHDQALGGVEVLRALKTQGVRAKVIIVTQYPDISVGGQRVKLHQGERLLSKRYEQDVIGSLLYKYRSPTNSPKLKGLLKRIGE